MGGCYTQTGLPINTLFALSIIRITQYRSTYKFANGNRILRMHRVDIRIVQSKAKVEDSSGAEYVHRRRVTTAKRRDRPINKK